MSAPLELHGVTRRFGTHVALQDVSLEVPAGAILGLLGPNGAGKSTLFSLCCGWLQPDAGHVRVLDLPPSKLHRHRGKVGVMPQDSLFPPQLSVDRELQHYARLQGLSPAEAARISRDLLERVGLGHATDVRGDQLSHGMLKRAAFAQALIGNPALLLLDEPTNGLDPENRRRVLDLIAENRGSRTVVVSSHLLSDLQEICSHVAVLHHGKLVAQGSMDDLTRASRRIRVRTHPDDRVPTDALTQRWGRAAVSVQGPQLSVQWPDNVEGAHALREVLELLFAHNVRVIEASQHASLEATFLEVTAAQPSANAAPR